ncbi:MAG TPA: mannose-6-phosphate isomerase, class I [Pseudonocardiaceae bacterium]|jgi:mannose-6-phosphate isomerase|nr:mannose-6-phosphate isomerase, class I [Pseudonocardiaceae bacterium]
MSGDRMTGQALGEGGVVELLRNVVRPYAWGSRTAIAELLGGPVPAPHPQAELWLGAHPADPSVLLHADGAQTSLLEALRTNPERHLGAGCTRRWGARLPFLLKVLAAEEPLSLQAHPSAKQAAEGFAREEARGIPRDAPERNYPDPSHKPELICALTELHALVGFRDPARTGELLAALDAPPLEPYRALLAGAPDEAGLRTLFTTWITLPQPAVIALLSPTLDACVRLLRRGGAGPAPAISGEFRAVAREVLALAEAHPGDVGVLAALLLNHVVLGPGEALYLPAGNLHTYLRGIGVEIMANSDNVLRGGLTAKHVDVPELLRVLDFSPGELSVLRGEPAGPHETAYPTPAEEFRLTRLEWTVGESTPVLLHCPWPQILLCTQGGVELRPRGGRSVAVPRGGSVWLAAADPEVLVCPGPGPVQLFRAMPGLAADQRSDLPDL